MNRKKAGMLGTLAGLAAMGGVPAQAATNIGAAPLQVASYADLLRPLPNAAEILRAHDAQLLEEARAAPLLEEAHDAPARVQQAQYYQSDDHHHHHHHHHHHEYYPPPPPPHHHHHHHHQGGVTILLPGIGLRAN